jgi:hypothetical protein
LAAACPPPSLSLLFPQTFFLWIALTDGQHHVRRGRRLFVCLFVVNSFRSHFISFFSSLISHSVIFPSSFSQSVTWGAVGASAMVAFLFPLVLSSTVYSSSIDTSARILGCNSFFLPHPAVVRLIQHILHTCIFYCLPFSIFGSSFSDFCFQKLMFSVWEAILCCARTPLFGTSIFTIFYDPSSQNDKWHCILHTYWWFNW